MNQNDFPTQTRMLQAERLKHLDLELAAFDDPEYAAQIAKFGDTGFEDLKPFLKNNNA